MSETEKAVEKAKAKAKVKRQPTSFETASREGRLVLKRTVGQWATGTKVQYEAAGQFEGTLMVRPIVVLTDRTGKKYVPEPIPVHADDLQILRHRTR